jgi:hypothetical protein
MLACDVCGWPGALIADSLRGKVLHAHHVEPLSAGGDDEWSNMLLLCPNHHAVCHVLYGHRCPNITRLNLIARLRGIDAAGPEAGTWDAVDAKKIMDDIFNRKLKRTQGRNGVVRV